MKNLLLLTIFFFSSLSFYAQDKYKSIAEYKTYDWITVKKVRLPEYVVADPRLSDELIRFVESEKSKEYYDKEAYIMVKKWSSDTLSMMSIYPNEYSSSYYGAYEGVMFIDGYTFIISLNGFDSFPFHKTGRTFSMEFIKLKQEDPFYEENGKFYFNPFFFSLPDPYEVGYTMRVIAYDSKNEIRLVYRNWRIGEKPFYILPVLDTLWLPGMLPSGVSSQ